MTFDCRITDPSPYSGMTGTRTSLRDQHGHVGVLLTCHGIVRYIDPSWIADELPSPPISAERFLARDVEAA